MRYMSTDSLPHEDGAIPPLTLGRRLNIAMEFAEVSREQMANEIGVDPATVSRWTHDQFKRPPMRVALQAWARLCGVRESWLIDGQGDIPTPPAFPSPVTESEEVAPVRRITTAKRVSKTPKGRNTVYCSETRGKSALKPAA